MVARDARNEARHAHPVPQRTRVRGTARGGCRTLTSGSSHLPPDCDQARARRHLNLGRSFDAYLTNTPSRVATNGKVERFNRTLLDEWAYARLWRSETSRARALAPWLHRYNHHRHHTAIDGPPARRINNLAGQNN